MPEPYNLTAITDADTIVETISAVNVVSSGLLGLVVLLLFTIILFVLFKNYEFKRALSGSLLISSIVAMLFRVIGLVNDTIMFSYFLVTAIAFVFLMWGD